MILGFHLCRFVAVSFCEKNAKHSSEICVETQQSEHARQYEQNVMTEVVNITVFFFLIIERTFN